MGKIAVVGSINTDLTMFSEKFAKPSENVVAYDFLMNAGGKGANQAVAAARFGSEVWMIGCVGDDMYGELAIKRFFENKIGTDGIVKIKESATGTALINVAGGENCITVFKGANDKLTPELIKEKLPLIDECDMVLLQYEIPRQTVEFVLDYCKSKKIKTLVNPAPNADITKIEWIKNMTYIIPNANEVRMIFGKEKLEKTVCKFPNKLIVTLGGEGSLFCDGTKSVKVPPIKITPIDPTGAGDTFCGVLASSITDGRTLFESITLANTAAGISTTKKGCQSAMPFKQEVMDYLNKGRSTFAVNDF